MFVNVQNNIFTIDRRSSNFPESCPSREGPYFFNRRRGSSLTSKKEDHLLNLIGSLFMQKSGSLLQHNVVDALHGGGDNNTVIVICTLLCVINSHTKLFIRSVYLYIREKGVVAQRREVVDGGGDVLPL